MGSFNLGRSEEAVQDEQLASLDLPKLKQANMIYLVRKIANHLLEIQFYLLR